MSPHNNQKHKSKSTKTKTNRALLQLQSPAGAEVERPLVLDSNGEPLYAVEQILDKVVEDDETFYYIKWRDYPPSYNTWEPAENLTLCPVALETFETNYSSGASVVAEVAEESVPAAATVPTKTRIRRSYGPPPKKAKLDVKPRKRKSQHNVKMTVRPQKADDEEVHSCYDSDLEDFDKDGAVVKSNPDWPDDILVECTKDREPDEMLGVTTEPGVDDLIYLIKWKPTSKASTSANEEKTDSDDDVEVKATTSAGKNNTDGDADEPRVKASTSIDGEETNRASAEESLTDCIIGRAFRNVHPQVVIAFYEKRIVYVRDQRSVDESLEDALSKLKLSRERALAGTESDEDEETKGKPAINFSSDSEGSEYDSDEEAKLEVDPTVSAISYA